MTLDDHTVEVDRVTADLWSAALSEFSDANLYQTWAYGAERWGEARTSRLLVRRGDGTVVGMAQLAVIKPLGLPLGVAQLRWGPVWSRRSPPPCAQAPRLLADALHAEYVVRRKLHLRVMLPPASEHETTAMRNALSKHFQARPFEEGESHHTLLVDLRDDLAVIRRRLDQKWRNQLNRAERNPLVVVHSDADNAFDRFATLYAQMVSRKGFVAPSVDAYRRMQALLPTSQRLQILICEEQGQPVAGIVIATIGATGVYVLGATNDAGMKCKGAYLLQWRAIEIMKQRGMHHYDLGGVDPKRNPGVAHFKQGLGGADCAYEQPLAACGSAWSRLAADGLRRIKQFRQRPGAVQAAAVR